MQPPLAEDEFELEDPVTRATSRLPSTTPSPNIRASLLFLTNPSLSEEDLEDEPEEPRNVPQRPPSIPTSTFRSPTPSAPVVTTFRPAVTPTSNPGLDGEAEPDRQTLRPNGLYDDPRSPALARQPFLN